MFARFSTRLFRTSNVARICLSLILGWNWVGLFPAPFLVPLCQAQENRNQFNLLLLPSSRQAQAALQQHCQIWSVQLLRPTINELESRYPISIWLDRRVDLGQPVALSRNDESTTLGSELGRMAISCGVTGGLVENVYAIAPANRLARIQRAAVVLHGQLASSQKSLADVSQAISWPEITSSNELLDLIEQKWEVDFGEVVLPHDLLHEGKLPKSTLATQLALILGGYDLQATLDASPSRSASASASASAPVKFKVQPLAPETAWQDTYARSLNPGQVSELQELFPQCTIESHAKNSVKIRGETNVHVEMLTLGVTPKRNPKKNPKAESRLSFEIKSPVPVEAVLKNLSDKLQFELVWSEECTSMHRNRLVQVKVDNATRQQLFEEVGKAAELSLVDHKTQVLISPR